MKNQLRAREEKFRLFESLLTGLDSVTQIFSGLSKAQQKRLAAKGVDLESGQKKLSEVLFKDANDYVEDLRAKVREEFLINQKELERERDLLGDSIEKQRNTMNGLGLLDEVDVEKSLGPLQSKLKTKLEELQRNEATIKALSSEIIEVEEVQQS